MSSFQFPDVIIGAAVIMESGIAYTVFGSINKDLLFLGQRDSGNIDLLDAREILHGVHAHRMNAARSE